MSNHLGDMRFADADLELLAGFLANPSTITQQDVGKERGDPVVRGRPPQCVEFRLGQLALEAITR